MPYMPLRSGCWACACTTKLRLKLWADLEHQAASCRVANAACQQCRSSEIPLMDSLHLKHPQHAMQKSTEIPYVHWLLSHPGWRGAVQLGLAWMIQVGSDQSIKGLIGSLCMQLVCRCTLLLAGIIYNNNNTQTSRSYRDHINRLVTDWAWRC